MDGVLYISPRRASTRNHPTMLLYVAAAVVLANIVTFCAFGIDKWKARRQARRIPEATLWALTWATGVVGGWAAMSFFRHKTQKTSFRIRMVAVSVLNPLWLLIWWAVSR